MTSLSFNIVLDVVRLNPSIDFFQKIIYNYITVKKRIDYIGGN